MLLEELGEVGEIAEGSRESVDLVHDHDVDPPRHDVGLQLAKARTVHVAAGVAAVIVPLRNDLPPVVSLTLDV